MSDFSGKERGGFKALLIGWFSSAELQATARCWNRMQALEIYFKGGSDSCSTVKLFQDQAIHLVGYHSTTNHATSADQTNVVACRACADTAAGRETKCPEIVLNERSKVGT